MHQVETMAYAGETPWHGLGTEVQPDLMAFEMLEAAGLNWRVEKRPMFIMDGNEQVAVDSARMLVRDSDGAQLSVISAGWEPIQNEEAFNVFTEFVDRGGMTMETAGSLRGGKMVWALARTKEEFQVFGDDTVRGYFLFANPHEYGKAATFGGTGVRVVCNNTLSFALKEGLDNKVAISHYRPFDPRMVEDAVSGLRTRLDQFEEAAKTLGSVEYTDETLEAYFGELFPYTGKKPSKVKAETEVPPKMISRNAKRAMEIVETQPGAEFAPNSWWQAYNAYTFLTDHEVGHSAANRLDSSWFGLNRKRKIKALDRAMDYAMAA